MEHVAISSDGHTIAFTSPVDGYDQVFVMLTSGGGPLLLTKDEGNKAVRGFSFDGAEIYFARTLGEYEIWSIPTLAALPNISPPANSSPHPRWPISIRGKKRFTNRSHRKGASAEEPITTLPMVSTLSMYPDGQHLLVGSLRDGKQTLQRLDLSSKKLETLSDLPGGVSSVVSWSVPGNTVLSQPQS